MLSTSILPGLNKSCLLGSAVGTPVARRPPHSPGREVFPHPVPRLYSLSRKTSALSEHPPTIVLPDEWSCYVDEFQDFIESPPVETLALASSSVEPFEGAESMAQLKKR